MVLKSIRIENFKGIKKIELSFNEKENIIKAKNGSGKTTIMNAWWWLLGVGIDNYIPNINNKEIECETLVEAVIKVNDYEYILTKISKPKYSKGERSGNELKYFIDGIEYQAKNYNTQISSIFSENAVENLQILTDKDFFNSESTKWKWSNRRQVLMQMAGVYEKTKDIIQKEDYVLIREDIIKGHSTSDLASQFRKDKKALKDEQLKNQALIEQKQKEINEYLGTDFEAITLELSNAKTKLTKLNNSSSDELLSEEYEKINSRLLGKTEQLTKIKTEDALRLSQLNDLKIKAFNKAKQLQTELTEFDEKDLICPYCHQLLPEEQIDAIENKRKDLKEKYTQSYKEFNEIDSRVSSFKENENIKTLENEIEGLKQSLSDLKTKQTNKSLEDEKQSLTRTISDLEIKLSRKSDLEVWGKQVKDWKKSSMDLADKIVDIETKERVLESYMREQTDIVINNINEKFSNGVSWSLYNQNYNGGLDEDCQAMYNGKLYSSLSTGEKYVTNMNIVNTLQNYYNVNIPIFVDNAEAITINYETDRQIIKLFAVADETLNNCVKILEVK